MQGSIHCIQLTKELSTASTLMATQLIQFRASGKLLEWLETQQLDAESLNLTAQRLLRDLMEEEADTSPDRTPKIVSTVPSTRVDSRKPIPTENDFEDIAKQYFAQAMNQTNKAIADLRAELLGELHA